VGIQDAVVGTVALKQERNKPARLEAYLRVIKVAAGKIGGEITREVGLEDVSNQEGALDLASRIAPQLYSHSRRGGEAASKAATTTGPEPEKPAGGDAPASQAEVPGRWTLNLPSAQYAHWKEIERVLREQFKSMHIVSLEMGFDRGEHQAGRGGRELYLRAERGRRSERGDCARGFLFGRDADEKLSFTPPGTVQAEPKK